MTFGDTEDWSESHEVVLKLREPGVPARHHGGTALACEMLASIWARVLGFEVPDYAIVEVTESFAASVTDEKVEERLSHSLGANFGTTYLDGCRTWQSEQRPLGSLKDVLARLVEFDSTILNGDRTTNKPNLLWDGKNCYPIDHSLALGVHRRTEENYESFLETPLMADEQIRAHVCHQLLRWKNLDYDAVARQWRSLPVEEMLDRMRDVLPKEWESEPGDYDRVFDFLRRRKHHFDAIVEQLERLLS